MNRIGINGFGRIGRMVFRRLIQEGSFEVGAINASYSAEQLAHLIKYDSVHGFFDAKVEAVNGHLIVNNQEVVLFQERKPENIPWTKANVSYVVESTGVFRTLETAGLHLYSGVEKVIVTAPAKDDMPMFVLGVNDHFYDGERVISNASCTTNCLAPIVKAVDDAFGIKNGLMTTIHSVTNDQVILDNPHKDLRRGRASGMNMVPTSTGAARAIGSIIPHLSGRLNGISVRVPTPNVSLVDVVFELKQSVTKESVNHALQYASLHSNGILDFNELPLVSSDYLTNSHSATIDGLSTMVLDENKVKILAWYDNEWGYSCRVVDMLHKMKTT